MEKGNTFPAGMDHPLQRRVHRIRGDGQRESRAAGQGTRKAARRNRSDHLSDNSSITRL